MSSAKYTAGQLKDIKSKTDWQRIDAMSDKSIVEAVETDLDTRLLDADDFKKMQRKGLQKAPLKEHVTSTPSLDNRRIIPANQSQDDCFDAPGVSDDFMEERDQPDDQIRETL